MDIFAQKYDKMVGADYNKITDFIDGCIKKYRPDSSLICDLGCGTGTVALELSHRGYDVIAIDSNETMLMMAREKAFEREDPSVLFLCQDIVNFELYGTVDVIYSTLDTVNYITSEKDLNTFFKWVRNYLNYDGLFIFDINSQYKFDCVLNNKTFVYDFEDMFCTWETQKEDDSDEYCHFLTYFIRQSDGMYERFDATQIQRFYSKELIEKIAKKYDFEIVCVKDDYSNDEICSKTQRYTYIMKTNKSKILKNY